MKVTLTCIEAHAGDGWKRFDFTTAGAGKDCPGGKCIVYTTEPEDFDGVEVGRTYEIAIGALDAVIPAPVAEAPAEKPVDPPKKARKFFG